MSVVQEIVLRLFVTRGIIVGMHFRKCTLLQQARSVFGSDCPISRFVVEHVVGNWGRDS